MQVTIVGWHIHPEAAVCSCGKPATVVAETEEYDILNLCNDCLKRYDIVDDKIEEVFRKAGF